MEKKKDTTPKAGDFSRRKFLQTLGLTTAGIFAAPYLKHGGVLAGERFSKNSSYKAKVAITQADNYERSFIKQKVQYLFESIDGIGDIVSSGKKVGIKINLTGGSGNANNSKLNGLPLSETMWTHPEVLRAVGELIIDAGVKPKDLYFVECLWDDSSFNDFGYKDVMDSLGASLVDLNKPDPYTKFVDVQTGDKKFYWSSFQLNQILKDIDVYVSIPKMKHHYEAGVTNSLKNQVGISPYSLYSKKTSDGYRTRIHFEAADIGIQLPNSICDLNLARPVNLAIIDGIKNARGGEGCWNDTFELYEDHVLIAGKDPVATDSIAAYLLGKNPEAEKFELPDGVRTANNHLYLLGQKGIGTNKMSEIEVVGDGAGLVTSVSTKSNISIPDTIQLFKNYPNPFNPSTTIKYYMPEAGNVSIKIFSFIGQEIETLFDGFASKGLHELRWTPKNIASGVYIYRMQSGNFEKSRKLIYQK
jgi:uncharacterized protein (DUF362 family)